MLEVEKKVRTFQRMQGNTLKGIYNRLSDFKPGGVRQLKPAFVEEANRVLNKSSDAGTLLTQAVATIKLTSANKQFELFMVQDSTGSPLAYMAC